MITAIDAMPEINFEVNNPFYVAFINNENVLQSIISLIDKTRRNVAIAVNSELTVLYWHINKQINRKDERNEYYSRDCGSSPQ
ncbi:MAG: hypothetical protein LBU22_14195 [Dysgonamonadaceae bacterium]|nr:hypothetical protein [Dysgonamonadaceae bacterium]